MLSTYRNLKLEISTVPTKA